MRGADWDIAAGEFYNKHRFPGWPEWRLLPLPLRRMWGAAYRGSSMLSSSTLSGDRKFAEVTKTDHKRYVREMSEGTDGAIDRPPRGKRST